MTRHRAMAHRAGWIVTIASTIALVSLLILFFVLTFSGGNPRPYLDEDGRPLPGRISEKIYVEINRAEQGMFIKGRDANNPVLLYLHGGMPDHFLTRRYPTGLDEYFIVAWWEQRGSGLSYSADVSPDTGDVRATRV
jgi:hypothetical protein